MSSIRIRNISIIVVIMLGLMMVGHTESVVASAPSYLNVAYDFGTQKLMVEIHHATSDINTHYIGRIEVSVNSVLNQTRDYTSQLNTIGMSDFFILAAVVGDVINVTAICSVSGQLTETLTLEEPSTFTTTEDSTTTNTSSTSPYGFESMMLIILGSATVLIIVIAVIIIKRR